MSEKIKEIFSCLLDCRPNYYEKIVPFDGGVEVITSLTKSLNHRSFITYDITSDQQVVRFETKYVFGNLYYKKMSIEDLLDILRQNDGTFLTTSCYAATQVIDDFEYISVQSCSPFLLKWPTKEIAEMLDLVFWDITAGLSLPNVTWPEFIQRFQPVD